jgi:catechol 2,3-dioxygenase-like lactoylglutathione lyase family enzyme
MKPTHLLNWPLGRATLAWLMMAAATCTGFAQDTNKFKEFSKPIIDIGMVARDVEKSARFYTEVIGFTEVQGFSVTSELGRKIGLVDGHPVTVRMFVLGQGDQATHLKLMSFPDAPGKAADQSFIHSTYGFRYLTLYVSSADRALERIKKAGLKTLGETPISLGKDSRLIVVRDPDGNFIELIGP